MDLLSFIRIVDPTKVRIGERQRDEDKPKLLETTVGRVVPLLPVAPDRSSGELEANVNKLLMRKVVVSRRSRVTSPVVARCWRQKKQKTAVVDAGEPSHPSAVQRLLVGAVLNAEVGGGRIPTLPFVTSSMSATPKRGAEVDSFAKPSAPVLTTAIAVTSTADPAAVTKEKIVEHSLFSAGSASGDGTDPAMGGFADLSGSDFLISGIRIVISPDTGLQKVAEVRMRVQYNIRERKRLQSIVKKKDTLLKEKDELDVKAADLAASIKVRKQEVADLDAVITSMHTLEISSVGLQEKVTAYENCMNQLEEFQDDRIKEMNDKFDKLDTDLVEMSLHLEERFYPHLFPPIYTDDYEIAHAKGGDSAGVDVNPFSNVDDTKLNIS
uniref:Transposase (Putative), gypsy type n=1 Tax=Tanacetum cinerariifolium TaxID=118510 RepID=A0A6L2N8A4_TANCI|nr:hypothetical protein [Tanacetum cinerariifolium]